MAIFSSVATGNLDGENSGNIQEILKELSEEDSKTVIVVTHDTDFANITREIFAGKRADKRLRLGAIANRKLN